MSESAVRERRWTKPPWRFPWRGVSIYCAGLLTPIVAGIVFLGLHEYEDRGPIYRIIERAPTLATLAQETIDVAGPAWAGREADPNDVRALGYCGSGWLTRISPDGRRLAFLMTNADDFNTVFVFDAATKKSTAIATLGESDPMSGIAFGLAWTADSKALVIYGTGPVYGYRFDENLLPLVWLVGDDQLVSAR
ncbi:MAG: hypothetical protein HY292_14015 [Planctomycetes bacterium]|nr:hypothetical protein [Planctomycetota bacterium]